MSGIWRELTRSNWGIPGSGYGDRHELGDRHAVAGRGGRGRAADGTVGRRPSDGRSSGRLAGVLLQKVLPECGLDVGVEDAPQALVVRRLDVPLVVGRLAEHLVINFNLNNS